MGMPAWKDVAAGIFRMPIIIAFLFLVIVGGTLLTGVVICLEPDAVSVHWPYRVAALLALLGLAFCVLRWKHCLPGRLVVLLFVLGAFVGPDMFWVVNHRRNDAGSTQSRELQDKFHSAEVMTPATRPASQPAK